MATKIYTKTGDKGKTSLIGGTKVSKGNARIEAYGTVDELNSYIGLVSDLLTSPGPRPGMAAEEALPGVAAPPFPREVPLLLREVQDRLFTIGSSLACDPHKEPKLKIPDLKEEDIALLEREMDEMNARMPPMTSFVLPVGHPTVSTAHIARCVCRRAERCCVQLQEQGEFVEPLVLKYVNRLSDYLFVLARFAAFELKVPEIPWRPRTV
jgi:cob(I)alamin adenosyltransferase